MEIALRRLGIGFIRTNVGDRYVMAELQKYNWLLGGEPSGHIVWLPATTTGDGIISALQVLAAMTLTGKSLHDIKADLHKFPQVIKNIALTPNVDPLAATSVQTAIREAEAVLNKKGRVVLRRSGTEALLRIMVEGEDIREVNIVAQSLVNAVAQVV